MTDKNDEAVISIADLKAMKAQYSKLQENTLKKSENNGFAALKQLIKELRAPSTGCPWDRVQDLKSFLPCFLEEAQEVKQAIDANDMENLKEEIGDVFFTLLFMLDLLEETGEFNLEDVQNWVLKKMVFRHPHVYGESPDKDISPEEALLKFKAVKKLEKENKLPNT